MSHKSNDQTCVQRTLPLPYRNLMLLANSYILHILRVVWLRTYALYLLAPFGENGKRVKQQ